MVDVLLGLQWGDEGKGKVADFLGPQYYMVARFQGGPNAGHSLEINGKKHVLNTLPSGIFHENCLNLIGSGVVIDPVLLKGEIERAEAAGASVRQNLYISKKAHLILPTHRLLDAASEAHKGDGKIGSTLRGISPSYQDKIGRSGLRFGDIEAPDFEQKYRRLTERHKSLLEYYNFEYDLKPLEENWLAAVDYMRKFRSVNSEYFINGLIAGGKKILAEGAQGSMLDIDFGTYPFVTSSNTITAGACVGLGISPRYINDVIGIFKAYCTRVGGGPFPTELDNEQGQMLRDKGFEYGATTGRPRRCGWLDLVALRYAIMLNGVTRSIMMKSDVLSGMPVVKAATSYFHNGMPTTEIPYDLCDESYTPDYAEWEGWSEDITGIRQYEYLPLTLKKYIQQVESITEVKVEMISVGPDRVQTIHRK